MTKEVNVKDLDIQVFFKPMIEVGGDIYDIYILKENRIRVFIADATGHGVQAALTTMLIKSEYDKIKIIPGNPNEVLKYFNNIFIKSYFNLTVFFTCAIIDIYLDKKEIAFSSGGHPPQYIFSNNELISLETCGKMIGISDNEDFILKTVPFNINDKIFLFTDGLFEEFSEDEEELGEEGLKKIITSLEYDNMKNYCNKIIEKIEKWTGSNGISDDIILVGIEYKQSN